MLFCQYGWREALSNILWEELIKIQSIWMKREIINLYVFGFIWREDYNHLYVLGQWLMIIYIRIFRFIDYPRSDYFPFFCAGASLIIMAKLIHQIQKRSKSGWYFPFPRLVTKRSLKAPVYPPIYPYRGAGLHSINVRPNSFRRP